MKNQILFLLSILGMALNLASCSTEDIVDPATLDSNAIHFDVSLPIEEIRTRGYGDGATVSNLKCYVYQSGAAQPMRTESVTITTANGKRGGSLAVDLPSGGTYDFVFLATSCPQDDKNSKLYYNPSARTLDLNYDKISGNDESLDCFFGVLPSISVDKGQSHKVTLKRPFAQLNIGTKDLSDYNTLASAPLQTVGVSVDGVYAAMNVMDGNCVGAAKKVTLAATAMPTGQTFPVKDASYLAMDYLLVKDRKNVDVSLTCSNGNTSFTSEYASVPLQRNCQTNLYGNLLTKENDFTVEVKPGFSCSENLNIDDPYENYDLVLKMSTHTYLYLTLYVTDRNNTLHYVDPSKYIDDNNIIKATWDELGIEDANSISFQGCHTLLEVIKCDINKLGVTSLAGFVKKCTYLKSVRCISQWDTSSITNMSEMFYDCTNLTTLDMSGLDTSNVTDMSGMFCLCNFEYLNISDLDTSNVTDMSNMFRNYNPVGQLDISTLDTRNVTDMNNMFSYSKFTNLDLSNFDTSKVTDMSNMFHQSINLQNLNVANFNTKAVKNMSHMFDSCTKLRNLNLSNFDNYETTDMSYMFYCCNNLETIDFTEFHTPKVENMSHMFDSCDKLISMDLSSFNTSNVTDMSYMFGSCKTLGKVDTSGFNYSHVKNFEHMFYKSGIQNIDFAYFETSCESSMAHMFEDCFRLQNADLSHLNTSNVINMKLMFSECQVIYNIDLSTFDTSKVLDMCGMFSGCQVIEHIDVSKFDTSNVTDMSGMFRKCYRLVGLDVSDFDTSNVTDMSAMFSYCERIRTLDLTNFNTSNVQSMAKMFENSILLNNLDISSFDTSNVTDMSAMFQGNPNERIDFISHFNTSKVKDMDNMFAFCNRLKFVDLSNFDTANVTNMAYMFASCTLLSELDLRNFETGKVTDMRYMFSNCSSLSILDLTSFDTTNVKNMQNMFSGCSAEVIWGPNGGLH